jgi:four helix bundle protein
MLSFQRLEVYQRSIEFFSHALEIIAELPSKGHADIADQLRRAAQSQPLNIAEGAPQGDFLRGAGRTSRPDVAKHYTIARGSAMECAAVLDVMKAQGTIHLHRYERGMDLLTSIVAMLTKMI